MSNNQVHILLVEDDVNLGNMLKELLEMESFVVHLYRDGITALENFKPGFFQLGLLDVMMPKMDGFTLSKQIKMKDESMPFLFITARSLKEDKYKGYELGADDYIVKPFDEDELLWKIKAVLKRLNHKTNILKYPIQLGQYKFDPVNQSLEQEGKIKRMTSKETEVLQYLAERCNSLVKREDLLTDLWGENDYFLGRSLDVFITKIRKYLNGDPKIKIETVFKSGFILMIEE